MIRIYVLENPVYFHQLLIGFIMLEHHRHTEIGLLHHSGCWCPGAKQIGTWITETITPTRLWLWCMKHYATYIVHYWHQIRYADEKGHEVGNLSVSLFMAGWSSHGNGALCIICLLVRRKCHKFNYVSCLLHFHCFHVFFNAARISHP